MARESRYGVRGTTHKKINITCIVVTMIKCLKPRPLFGRKHKHQHQHKRSEISMSFLLPLVRVMFNELN